MAKKVSLLLSHWYKLLEGQQGSPKRFYTSLEKAIEKRKLPDLKISRIDYHESGVFSAKREYLRVNRKEFIFDVCAAPFGNGFFVSWWLGESVGLFWRFFLKIPLLGRFLLWFFRPLTYYQIDTALMFQESVHLAVLEVVDQMTKAKGLRLLSELERKPILSDFLKR